jgi:PAS domain S-box-containing protein
MQTTTPDEHLVIAEIAGLRERLDLAEKTLRAIRGDGSMPATADALNTPVFPSTHEEALRISEERFRGAFEHAAIGMAHAGLDHRLLRVNQAFCNLVGYSRDELLETSYVDITHPDDVAGETERRRRLLEDEAGMFTMEKRYLHKNGSHVWANLTVSLMPDAAGRPLYFISTVEDIGEKRAALDEAKRHRNFIERVTEVAPDIQYVFDIVDTRCIWANRRVEKLIGYSVAEIVEMGPRFLEHMCFSESKRISAHIEALGKLAPGESIEREYRFRHRNGEWLWFRSREAPFAYDPDGRVREIVGTATDITDRKRDEEKLRESEEKLRLALEAAEQGSWEIDLATGAVTASPWVEAIFGVRPEDNLETRDDWRKLVVDSDRESIQKAIERACVDDGRYRVEFRIRRAIDGDLRWVLSEGRVLRDRENQPRRLIGVVRDITERRQAELALHRSEQFARSQWTEAEAAIEAIPANIALLDSDGVIVRVNTAWTTFAASNGGRHAKVGIGTNYLSTCDSADGPDAEDAKRFAAGIRSVLDGSVERFSMEYPCHSPDCQRWFIGYVTASAGGGPARAVVAHVDISEQKRIQEEIHVLNQELESRVLDRTRELKSAVDALESEIARRQRLEREILGISEREQCRIGQDLHDGLGQELAGIAMIVEILANRLEKEAHPSFADADEIAAHTRRTIESARLLAKGLYPVELGLYGLIFALEDLAHHTRMRFGVRCELRQEGEAPELGESAAIHIYRMVQESIGNAIKHGRASHIVIESLADESGYRFTITDDGTGFKRPVPGTGMGLHIMEYRARVIGAEFSVEMPAQGGCRVICRIPR